MTRPANSVGRWLKRRRPARANREGGYVAILVTFFLVLLVGLSAFVADVGNWYLVGMQAQKAADAAALAGVVRLPADQTGAYSTARAYSASNGFTNGVDRVTVVPGVGGQPSQLRVTVTKVVRNGFAGLFGVNETTITKTAVADFIAPIPMGSPCNQFGDDPDPVSQRSANCAGAGRFWASIAAPTTAKSQGDAYASQACTTTDGCTGSVNNEYNDEGYFYQVDVTRATSNLTFQIFDPAFIGVGATCGSGGLNGPAGTRYASGPGVFCTGDQYYSSAGTNFTTTFTVRAAVSGSNPWDPHSYPAVCTQTFGAFNPGSNGLASSAGVLTTAPEWVKDSFRRWVNICTIASAPVGKYFIQVQSTGTTQVQNRFAMGAWSSTDSSAKNHISVAGWKNMGIFANVPGGTPTTFHLVRVPSAAAGQILNVRLYDIGDLQSGTGSITLLNPSNAAPAGCIGGGVVTGSLSGCGFSVGSAFQGRWQTIKVPIPVNYTCDDDVATACWYRLRYNFSTDAQPTDTTSWTAGLEGNPVRLIE